MCDRVGRFFRSFDEMSGTGYFHKEDIAFFKELRQKSMLSLEFDRKMIDYKLLTESPEADWITEEKS